MLMKRHPHLGLLGTVAVTVLLQRGLEAKGLPLPQRTVTVIDFPAAPPSLDEMWERTPVIVRAKVVASGRATVAAGEEAVHRPHILELIEVLRDSSGSLDPGKRVRVLQYGGTADLNGKLVSTVNSMSRLFEVGDEVVLFLDAERKDASFSLRFGGAGAFWLGDNKESLEIITVPTAVRRMEVFKGRSQIQKAELLGLFRKLSRGRS
jgi:hypothetical protein